MFQWREVSNGVDREISTKLDLNKKKRDYTSNRENIL